MRSTPTIFSFCVLLCISNFVLSNNNTPPPPINDLCSGAIDLGLIDCGFYVEFFEDPEATPDIEASGNCIDNTEPGQWYTFSTPDPLPYGTMLHFSPTAKVEIFSTISDCSELVYEGCGIGAFPFKVEAATTYYYLTTGGFHLQPPSSNLSTCDDPLVSFNFNQNPIITSSYTDCAAFSGDVGCENDHVIWIGYTVGCGESSDVLIEVGPYSANPSITAGEISITIISGDCSALLSEYDENGLGYVCSAMGAGESINLVDIPPGLSFVIGIGSSCDNTGYFNLNITETTISGSLPNDLCLDAEVLMPGLNTGLSNACAMPDVDIQGCAAQSEATVWYEFDPGNELQNLLITLFSNGINAPAIAIYDACDGNLLESVCGTSLELMCIDSPILIQIGSSLADGGLFDLEIFSSPSFPALVPVIIGNDICSETEAGITINIPGGELVKIIVEIAPGSSAAITGITNQTFSDVNTGTINDILFNSSLIAQEAKYIISLISSEDFCLSDPIEYSIMVYPGFIVNDFSLDECLPFITNIDADQIIQGGTMPYVSTLWYWNSTELIGSDYTLSTILEESGVITLEVVDSEGCTKSAEIDVELSPTITPTFDFPLAYCRSKQDIILFPLFSLENIEGTWSTPMLDLDIFANDGSYNIIFTADEPHCIMPVILSIQIYSGDEPIFDLPPIICKEENVIVFPTEDINGVLGTWETPSLDVSMISGMQTNVFTPISEDCYKRYEYVFEVPLSIESTFGQPETLCRIDAPYVLNNTSEDGYVGNWDVSIIDPSLISGNSFTCIWTPIEGQFPCLYEDSVTFQIIDPSIPVFNLPDKLCALDTSYTFPKFDNQSISGTWSIPTINPSEVNGSIQSVFTSDIFCVETVTWEIEIIDPLVPEFNMNKTLCSLDAIYTLPLTSDNGIPGTWSQPMIDPSISSGEQIIIEFQGDPSEFCIEPIEIVFEIIAAQDPIFDFPTKVCWKDEDLVLPSSSINAIEGIWEPPIIDVQSNPGTMISSTFTATDGSCSNLEVLNIEIISPYVVEANVTNPSDCVLEDGSILLEVTQGNNLEYSIDGGINWQNSSLFNSLGSGGYTILVRSSDLTDCTTSIETFLSSPDGPIINEVLSIDINSCVLDNGRIIIDAEGNDLEYSIDEGITWQTSNEFGNLSTGSYVVSVREAMSDCIVKSSAMIMDFPQTEIVTVNTQDLTDCNIDDGQIEIIAVGEALEYSIDNGATWSLQNTFNDLPSGEFIILVQSTIGENCLASSTVDLIAPSAPNIINFDILNPSQCEPNTGRLEIEAEGNNLEFSIDGGLTWQSNNLFIDLESDQYQLIVRDSERINCSDAEALTIILEDENLPESSVIITPPSECDFSDAKLEVTNATGGVEYSLDGGLSWQTENVFDNLLTGTYQLITRKILLPECLIIQEIDIPNTACPCNDLEVEFMTSNITCTGDDSALVELISIQGMKDSNIEIKWQNGETDLSIEVTDEGWQMVTIEYDDDCIWIDSVWVELVRPIEFELYAQNLDCPEVNNGLLEVLNVTGGSGDYEYSLDGIVYQVENIFDDLEAAEYQVFVRDETNCLTINEVEILTNDKIEISLPEIETIFNGESVLLDPNIDSDRIGEFNWSPLEGIQNPNDLVITVSPTITTAYTLEIFYGDCSASQGVTVYVKPEEEVYIGNVFSPNGDHNNDRLYMQGVPNSTIELDNFSIFDRWGNKLFYASQPEFNNKEDGWDGRYNGALASSGVYVYFVNYTQYGQAKVKIGTITLVY